MADESKRVRVTPEELMVSHVPMTAALAKLMIAKGIINFFGSIQSNCPPGMWGKALIS
jgi:hypothetical protein